MWTFAGGRASAAIARALRRAGLRVASWDDLSVTIRCELAEPVIAALAAIDPLEARPDLPPDLDNALKFSVCLPKYLIEQIFFARLADPEAIGASLSRRVRSIRHVASLP